MALIAYKFGYKEEDAFGTKWKILKTIKCDSDAQAELEARHFCEKVGRDGIDIKRGDAVWYCRA